MQHQAYVSFYHLQGNTSSWIVRKTSLTGGSAVFRLHYLKDLALFCKIKVKLEWLNMGWRRDEWFFHPTQHAQVLEIELGVCTPWKTYSHIVFRGCSQNFQILKFLNIGLFVALLQGAHFPNLLQSLSIPSNQSLIYSFFYFHKNNTSKTIKN